MSRAGSPGGGGKEVGRVEIGVHVTGVSQTESELGRVRQAGQQTAGSLKQTFTDFGKSLREPVQAITRITGAITAAAGALVLFYEAGRRLRHVLLSGGEAAEEFSYSLATKDAQSRVDALDAKLQKLDETMARMRELGPALSTALFGRTPEQVSDEIEALRKDREAAQRELNDAKRAAERARREAEERSRRDKLAAVTDSFLKTAGDREVAELQRRLDDLQKEMARNQGALFQQWAAQYEAALRQAIQRAMRTAFAEQFKMLQELRQEFQIGTPAASVRADLRRIGDLLELISQQRR